jgi:transcriptional regulator with XRE-family HTH domain
VASFGETIRRRRQALGLNQTRLGELVGKPVTTVRAWEQGKMPPSEPSTVSALAAILGVEEKILLQQAGFATEVEQAPVSMSEAYASLSPAPGSTAVKAVAAHTAREDMAISTPAPIVIPGKQAAVNDLSYMEVPSERRRYQQRAIATAVIVGLLVIVLIWSFREASSAFGDLWDDFLGQLDF